MTAVNQRRLDNFCPLGLTDTSRIEHTEKKMELESNEMTDRKSNLEGRRNSQVVKGTALKDKIS